jgi:hypothetical protein
MASVVSSRSKWIGLQSMVASPQLSLKQRYAIGNALLSIAQSEGRSEKSVGDEAMRVLYKSSESSSNLLAMIRFAKWFGNHSFKKLEGVGWRHVNMLMGRHPKREAFELAAMVRKGRLSVDELRELINDRERGTKRKGYPRVNNEAALSRLSKVCAKSIEQLDMYVTRILDTSESNIDGLSRRNFANDAIDRVIKEAQRQKQRLQAGPNVPCKENCRSKPR